MVQELKAICRKKGLQSCLLFSVVAAVCIFVIRTELMLFFTFGNMDYIEKKDIFYFMSFFAVIMLLLALWSLIDIISGRSVKIIRQFPEEHPEYTLNDIEKDFSAATVYEGNFFVGNEFLIYVTSSKARILILKDIVWAYYKETTKNYATTSYIVLNTYNNKYYEIILKKKETIEEILKSFHTRNLPIITGYNKELKNLYRKNPAEFVIQANGLQDIADAQADC